MRVVERESGAASESWYTARGIKLQLHKVGKSTAWSVLDGLDLLKNPISGCKQKKEIFAPSQPVIFWIWLSGCNGSR